MIHKVIENLRRKGYVIVSHSKKGYKLLLLDDLSLAGSYIRDLGTRIDFYVHYVPQCSSTQDIAKSLAESGVPEGLVVIAEEMYSGRGRLGRKWYAPKGGLWISILLRPKRIESLQLMSLATGVAVVKAIERLLNVELRLKWPNDVIYMDRKLAGILVEAGVEVDIVHYVIVGIGVNVNNELPSELKDYAVNLKSILGFEIPRISILRSLLRELDDVYYLLTTSNTYTILREWIRYSDTIGRRVKVQFMDFAVEGKAVDIARDGSLIVIDDTGKRYIIRAGDVIHLK